MTAIPKISALFETSLASSLSAAGTSFTVVSGTDRDGNALSGLYPFIIDEGTADEEFIVGTISGTTVTITYRGCDADTPTTEVSANKKAHRRGASVKITDYPILGYLRALVNGDFTFPNKLSYESHPTFSSNTEIIDKKYADDLAIAGAPDSSTTTKGIVEEATQAEVDARTTTGGTSAKLFAPLDKIRASMYHDYAADAGGTDAYAITIAPVITAYSAGQVFVFKANTANTGAATLNVSGLGAKTIKKYYNQDLETGDILVSQIVVVVYDGTNMQLQSDLAKPKLSQSGSEIYAASATGNDTYVVTLTPVPSAYTDGLVVNFKVDTANTGAATLNVNSLGAITIKKKHDQDLATGDIEANQIVTVVYNSSTAKFQMISQVASENVKYATGTFTRAIDATSGSQSVTGVGFTPKILRIRAAIAGITDAASSWGAFSDGVSYNAEAGRCVYGYAVGTGAPASLAGFGPDTSNIIHLQAGTGAGQTAAITSFDADGFTFSFTKVGTPDNSDNATFIYEAEG